MRALAVVCGTLFFVIFLGVVFIHSGFYNVAANSPHGAVERWLLRTTMRQSVTRYAAEIPAPPADSLALTKMGVHHYQEMCVPCHGAPGVGADEVGKGLMPPAPDLSNAAAQWSTQELFWIIKHGIRFTGMPAWGATHSDEEIWALAKFVQKLPALNAEQYRAIAGKDARVPHRH